jgi:hypothetical protein
MVKIVVLLRRNHQFDTFPLELRMQNTNSLKCYKMYWNSSMPKPQWRQNMKETSGRLKAADLVCLCLFEVPTSWGKSFEAKSLRYPCLSFSAIPSVLPSWELANLSGRKQVSISSLPNSVGKAHQNIPCVKMPKHRSRWSTNYSYLTT